MKKKYIILCLTETVFANVVIFFLFFKFQYNQDLYLRLNPHPLFILCIAIGIRYGNYLGIISSLITSTFYIYVFLQINESIWTLFSSFDNYKYLLLFFWSAIIFGTFKDNYKANIQKLTNENTFVKESYRQLEKLYKLNEKLLEELKKQIINSEESILNLYEIASRLSNLDTEEIYTETLGILSKYLKADIISIYSFDERSGYLRLKIKIGSVPSVNRSLQVKNSSSFYRVIYDKQVVRWADVKEEGFPLMSAPIVRDNNVLALVNIEHMDYDHLSEYAFQLFRLIIDWVNRALQQANYVDKISKSKYFSGTRIMTLQAFQGRERSEERRKREFGMDYSIIKFKVKKINMASLNEKLTKIVRQVDIIGFEPINNLVLILLPATPKESSYIVQERILKYLEEELI